MIDTIEEGNEDPLARSVTLFDMTPCDEELRFLYTQAGEYA